MTNGFKGMTALAMVALLGSTAMTEAKTYKIGVSNTVQGNGWREEMVCAMKAQALASGEVSSLNIAHRNTDAAGQLEDIRNLISAGVDAIVVNPSDAAGINAALKDKAVIDSLAITGLIARGSTPEEQARSQRTENERWGPLVKKIGFTAES